MAVVTGWLAEADSSLERTPPMPNWMSRSSRGVQFRLARPRNWFCQL